ncbi:MAG: hypothetical protein ACO3FT_07325 [Ilumatobacteraceae bacterium]
MGFFAMDFLEVGFFAVFFVAGCTVFADGLRPRRGVDTNVGAMVRVVDLDAGMTTVSVICDVIGNAAVTASVICPFVSEASAVEEYTDCHKYTSNPTVIAPTLNPKIKSTFHIVVVAPVSSIA